MDEPFKSAYIVCVLVSAILYTLSYRRPPPPKDRRASSDIVASSFVAVAVTSYVSLLALAPAIAVAALVVSGPDPSPSDICPRPANVSPVFITFNRTTVTVLICTFTGSLLRYTAMAQLGRSFTWELARPAAGFKQDGLYRYMQHPSYTGAFIANLSFLPFFWRFDGPLGCWVPAWLAHSQWMNSIHVPLTVFAMLWSLRRRIPEEEAMMKREFGKEWVMYHRYTKRFIPGVF